MVANRVIYRARQFFLALGAVPSTADLERVRQVLNPAEMALFRRMQPGEQVHSLKMLLKLTARGEMNPDLLVAALLHDVGKSRAPLNVWERVVVVLGKVLAPKLVQPWGVPSFRCLTSSAHSGHPVQFLGPERWRKPFIVAAQHATWGAELASEAGASPLTVELISRHQNPVSTPTTEADQLLQILQQVDDEN